MQRQKLSFAVLALIGAVNAKTCPFGHGGQASSEGLAQVDSKSTVKAETDAKAKSDYTYSSELFDTGIVCLEKTVSTFDITDYENIVADINAIYELTDATVEANNNPRAQLAGCVLRIAGHDFMDYRIGGTDGYIGGSDGCINFEDHDNTGIVACAEEFGLVDAYAKFCDKVSLADWMVIAGEAMMGRTATDYSIADGLYDDGKLAQTFRDNFKAGRVTETECSQNVGLMPDPANGCTGTNGLQDIFVDNIYATSGEPWALTLAINGVHTIGRANVENSGFDGYWSTSDQQGVFNNDYYHSLLLKGWSPEYQTSNGKYQWARVDKGIDADGYGDHKELMLDTDMCTVYKDSKDYSDCMEAEDDSGSHGDCMDLLDYATELNDIHSRGENCCGWIFASRVFDLTSLTTIDYCGIEDMTEDDVLPSNRAKQCCIYEDNYGDSYGDCDSPQSPEGIAYSMALNFLEDEAFWLQKYQQAWWFATENGYADGDLWYLDGSTTNQLQAFDCNAEFTEKADCKSDHPDCEWISNRKGCMQKTEY